METGFTRLLETRLECGDTSALFEERICARCCCCCSRPAGVLHCAFEAEAGTEERTCLLPEDQGALSFWTEQAGTPADLGEGCGVLEAGHS